MQASISAWQCCAARWRQPPQCLWWVAVISECNACLYMTTPPRAWFFCYDVLWGAVLWLCWCLQVDQHLRVVGHPRLFALGDVTDVQEEKLAFLAAQQATLVAANLTALAAAAAAGGEAAMQAAGSKLRCWRPSAGIQVLFVSIGRK